MSVRSFFRLDDAHPFTGLHMLAVVLLFFGTIIAVNVVMAISATRTFPGLIVKNSYVASQNYNARLAEAREQAGRGVSLAIVPKDGILTFEIRDPAGAVVRDLEIHVIAGRPSSTRDDRILPVVGGAAGYVAGEPLAPGLWEIDLAARRGGLEFYRERRRIVVSGEGD